MYKQFIYRGFTLSPTKEGFKAVFDFEIPDLAEFHPTWEFPFKNADLKDKTLNALIFSLGMTELVSYWKCCCPPEIVVECGALTDKQVAFFKKLYFNGLGEFFYRNGIKTNERDFVSIVSKGESYLCEDAVSLSGALIPVGGGKDSVVTLELTKKLNMKRTPYMINPHKASVETARVAGFNKENCICPKRTIDRELIRLNGEGFLNGHTPFSAIVAFSAVISAYLSGHKYVVLSNEASANEATVEDVNHQYSKSITFEADFREYLKDCLSCPVEYFSLLRPFAEIRIAKNFARHPQYFPVFLSCNLGSKTDSWCGHCPKCLFVYLMLLPFTEHKTLNGIFSRDLANAPDMLEDFRKLLGVEKEKPFECVGSVAEANLACFLAVKEFERENRELPLLLKEYRKLSLPVPDESILSSFESEHFVPEEFLPCLDDTPEEPLEILKAEFKNKSLAILGFGREGLSTYRFYRSLFPEAEIVIADKMSVNLPEYDENATCVTGGGYLNACKNADMVMISPGIPRFNLPEWILPKLKSQTELFLKAYGKQVLGVTGTKGKSTCSSLIHSVIKNSILVGNIGKPVFDSLDEIKEDTLVVYELSCHQLEDCEYSPKYAVMTNLFEEHLDHYGTFDRYFKAKKNIFRNRNLHPDGICICDRENTRFEENELPEGTLFYSFMSENADIFVRENTIVTPLGEIETEEDRIKVKGRHNFGYCAIAYFFAKKFNVSDEEFLSALYSFSGLPHRLEFVKEVKGVSFYDDSISTIPQATVEGIRSLKNVKSVIIGGMERNVDLTYLADFLAEYPLDCIILIPETGERFKALLTERGITENVYFASDIPEAVSIALEKTENGICLFSPAAASYHLYKNFEARGDHFKEIVKGL